MVDRLNLDQFSVHNLTDEEKKVVEALALSLTNRGADAYRDAFFEEATIYFERRETGPLMVGVGSLYDDESFRTVSSFSAMVDDFLSDYLSADTNDPDEYDRRLAYIKNAERELRVAADRVRKFVEAEQRATEEDG